MTSLGVAVVALLKFAPVILKTGGTMLLTIVIYGRLFGWKYAIGFVLLIFVHECGHLLAARMMGLKVGWPVFIPFMGAMIALKEAPRNAWIEAIVGIGGPILGAAGALAVYAAYLVTGHPLYLSLAFVGFLLNLFNLVPIVPLDGGRIVAAISPWLWVVGLVVLLPVLWWSRNPLVFFLVFLSLPRLVALFRKRSDVERRYYECSASRRAAMALMYFVLLIGLAFFMTHSHSELDRRLVGEEVL